MENDRRNKYKSGQFITVLSCNEIFIINVLRLALRTTHDGIGESANHDDDGNQNVTKQQQQQQQYITKFKLT